MLRIHYCEFESVYLKDKESNSPILQFPEYSF